MARNVRTARGEIVDFDMLLLKQKIADAPMNIEVQRRKEFIDNKEGRARGTRAPAPQPAVEEVVAPSALADVAHTPVAPTDFEIEGADPTPKKRK